MRSKILQSILAQPSVVFDKDGHTYTTKDGQFYTSCTTVAEAWKKDFLGPWYAKEAMIDLGWFDMFKDGRKRLKADIETDKASFAERFEKIKAMEAGDYYDLLQNAKGAAKRKGDLAKENGTLAHAAVQSFIESKIDPSRAPQCETSVQEVLSALNSFLVWEKQQDVDWLATEEVVSLDKYKIAGQVDAIANYNKLPTIADIKTSGQVSSSYLLQLAGYDIMLASMGWQARQWLIMRTPKDGSPMETLTINNLEDMEFFRQTFLHQREAHKFYSYMKTKYEDATGKIKVDQLINQK